MGNLGKDTTVFLSVSVSPALISKIVMIGVHALYIYGKFLLKSQKGLTYLT